jgi:hypothetical protein
MEPEYKAGKEVVIAFGTAIARENNRGSITSAQRAGRATTGSRSEPVLMQLQQLQTLSQALQMY